MREIYMNFSGKCAISTGAVSGMRLLFAENFAELGGNVVLCDVRDYAQINIGSITGAEGSKYGMDYPTAKAGLMHGLTKSIAQFGSKYGIRCVCVSPGPVLTRANMASMKTLLGSAAGDNRPRALHRLGEGAIHQR